VLSQGDTFVPIPGTKRAARVEENVGADDVVLSPAQIEALTNMSPAAGGHHSEAQMQMLDR
jgi:aryl-alcohol dehydrogenase-like predicted oxidoreductase